MAITPFKVIQGHRFWYQLSKAHMRLVINTNVPSVFHRFQVMADFMCQILASYRRGVSSHLTPSLGAIPCEYRYKRPLKTRFFRYTFHT